MQNATISLPLRKNKTAHISSAPHMINSSLRQAVPTTLSDYWPLLS